MDRFASLGLVLLASSLLAASAPAQEGVLNFGPEEIIKAKGKEIVVPGYSVTSFEDWNNDHLKDLIVGEGGGAAPGKIRVYLNRGTESDPCFVDYFYVESWGQDLTCVPGERLGCFPRVVHWDADNRKDLLVGLADGRVVAFVNIGTDNDPVFDAGTEVRVGPSWATVTLNVGADATPVLPDWNNDGMLDIVAGGYDGGIHYYYNCGCGGWAPPHFSFSTYDGELVWDASVLLRVPSGSSSPVVMDLDGNGKKDLLIGNANGQILFYRNNWADIAPGFVGYSVVHSAGRPIDLPGSLCSRPFVCHWAGSAHWDLLVGYGDGKIRLYRGLKAGDFNGNGTLDADDLTALTKALDKPVPAGGSPYDLNKDGVVNLLDLRLFADLWLAEYGADQK